MTGTRLDADQQVFLTSATADLAIGSATLRLRRAHS
jgi:hypothetical protein